MNLGRVGALTGSNLKRSLREPSFLFLVLMFPVALTVLFGTAFGAVGGGSAEYNVGVVDLDSSQWSKDLVADLEGTQIISVHSFEDGVEAQRELSQGSLQAVVIIPRGFGDSCQSYVDSPEDSSLWTLSDVQLFLDPGSMISSQAIPPMVEQVLFTTVYGETTVSGPVSLGKASVASGEKLTAFDYMAPGVITFSAIFFTMIVGQSFTFDRESGVLRRIRLTPTSSGEFIASHVLSNMALALVQGGIVFGLMMVLGFHSASSTEGMVVAFLLVVAFSVSAVGFGLITASLAKSSGQATGLAFLFIMPQMFLGTFMGASLSSTAQSVGSVLPAYYLTDALNTILLRGGSVSSTAVLTDAVVIVLFGVATLVAGTVLFRRYGDR